jgi:hypothetical protein
MWQYYTALADTGFIPESKLIYRSKSIGKAELRTIINVESYSSVCQSQLLTWTAEQSCSSEERKTLHGVAAT